MTYGLGENVTKETVLWKPRSQIKVGDAITHCRLFLVLPDECNIWKGFADLENGIPEKPNYRGGETTDLNSWGMSLLFATDPKEMKTDCFLSLRTALHFLKTG